MSEKRILIKWVTAPYNGCSGVGENVCDNCCDWDMWNSCLTREKVIDKMIKYMCPSNCNTTCEHCSYRNNEKACKNFTKKAGYNRLAEAGLNALLEGKQ